MNQRKRGAYGTRYGWQSIILFKHCACWFVVYADDSRYLLETAYVAGQPYQYLVSAGYWYASVAENEELGHGEVFPGFSCSTEQLFEATSKSPDLVVVLH